MIPAPPLRCAPVLHRVRRRSRSRRDSRDHRCDASIAPAAAMAMAVACRAHRASRSRRARRARGAARSVDSVARRRWTPARHRDRGYENPAILDMLPRIDADCTPSMPVGSFVLLSAMALACRRSRREDEYRRRIARLEERMRRSARSTTRRCCRCERTGSRDQRRNSLSANQAAGDEKAHRRASARRADRAGPRAAESARLDGSRLMRARVRPSSPAARGRDDRAASSLRIRSGRFRAAAGSARRHRQNPAGRPAARPASG